MADIGALLRERRIKKNLTQRSIADFVGVTEATVSRWESGEIGNMRRDKIAKLATILDISPLTIMDLDNNSPVDLQGGEAYYHDPEVAQIAEEMKNNPGGRVLFDASRGLSKEAIEEVRKFIEFQKSKESL